MFAYIEDILHLYVDTIGVNDADNPILTSISKQCKKGIALTDRQYDLVKNKLLDKAELFKEHCSLNDCLQPRLPLRQIDRSKYITLVTHYEMMGSDRVYESYKENWVWVKIRFPFSKKLIAKLDQFKSKINNKHQYYHEKGSHEHYFKLAGDVVYWMINIFQNNSFEIDAQVLEYYNSAKKIIENPDDYLIKFVDGKFKNLHEKVMQDVTDLTDLCAADKQIRYGYTVDNKSTANTLTEVIAYRNEQVVCVNPEDNTLEEVAQSLKQLNRFPMIVLIDNDMCYEQVKKIHQAFDFIDNSLQSVLFRVDAEPQYNLNDYIKDNALNNWVDNNTQIVYIKKNQLPKIMFTGGFTPITAFAITSYRSNSTVESYVKFNCDLILYHDKEKSIFGRYSAKYGFL